MGRLNYLKRNAANARKSKTKPNKNLNKNDQEIKESVQYPKIKANQLFGSAILTDGTYKNDTDKLDLLGIDHEGEASFYRAQKKYSKPIINAAKDSCVEAIHEMKGKLKTSSDASYDHERNGSWCSSYFMCNNKCLGFETIGKVGGKRTMGTFKGASTNMETVAFRGALNDVLDNLGENQQIESINHDDDNNTGKVINEYSDIEEQHDINHYKKSLGKKFDGFKRNAQHELHKNRLFSGMRKHLLSWFTFIVMFIKDKIERGRQWLNTSEHWTGHHQNCYHTQEHKKVGRPKKNENKKKFWFWREGIKNKKLKDKLDDFLLETEEDVIMVGSETSTNPCESMNSLREIQCDKRHSWGDSAPVRTAVSVLRKNHPNTYQKEVMHICGVNDSQMSPLITTKNIKNTQLNTYKRTPLARKIKNEKRIIERENHKSKLKGDYGYKRSFTPDSSS